MGMILVSFSSSAKYLDYYQEKKVVKTNLWRISGKERNIAWEHLTY